MMRVTLNLPHPVKAAQFTTCMTKETCSEQSVKKGCEGLQFTKLEVDDHFAFELVVVCVVVGLVIVLIQVIRWQVHFIYFAYILGNQFWSGHVDKRDISKMWCLSLIDPSHDLCIFTMDSRHEKLRRA